jgi:hypothetical protein
METRSWDTKVRGPIAIHAAFGFDVMVTGLDVGPEALVSVDAGESGSDG